jgi:hypothetical protein
MLIYGIYLTTSVHSDYEQQNKRNDSDKIKNYFSIYIISRAILLLLITKMQFNLKRNIIPDLLLYQTLPL